MRNGLKEERTDSTCCLKVLEFSVSWLLGRHGCGTQTCTTNLYHLKPLDSKTNRISKCKSLSRAQITDPKAQESFDFILRTMRRRVKPFE